MLKQLRPAILMVVVMTVLTGFIYPFVITGIAQALFPKQANGSLIRRHGRLVGSRLIGQNFTGPEWFHPRPSAAGSGYDATQSGGSNLGPTNRLLIGRVRQLAQQYRKENGLPPNAPIPSDAVTESASGLDPDISPANARIQAARVARARGLPIGTVKGLIARCTRDRTLGLLGEPRVNVLELNLALARLSRNQRK